MDRYELRYVTGPLHHQVASAWKQVITLSLPNGAWASAKNDPVGVAGKGVAAASRYGASAASRLLRSATATTALAVTGVTARWSRGQRQRR